MADDSKPSFYDFIKDCVFNSCEPSQEVVDALSTATVDHISPITIYSWIGNSVESAISKAASGAIGGTISLITGTVIVMTTIYYVIMGYQIMAGVVQNPVADFIKSALKFVIISAFALNAENYGNWVGGSIINLANGITSAWSGMHGTPYDALDAGLTSVADKAYELIQQSSDAGAFDIADKLMLYGSAIIIMIAGIIVTLPAAAMIICAKAMLLLLIAVGPFFVASLMFPVTSKWFESWFGQIMTQIFTIAFISMISSIALVNLITYAGTMNSDTTNYVIGALLILTVSALMLWVMYRASNLAAGLAGGVSSSCITFGAMAGAAMGLGGKAASAAKGVSRGMRKKGISENTSGGQKAAYAVGRGLRSGKEHIQHAYQATAARMRQNSIKPA
jgi:type IV secretion system protein VirB6